MNEHILLMQKIDKPLTLYKEGEAAVAEKEKKREEKIKEVKSYWYPFWGVATIVYSILAIGWYYQE